MAIVTALVAVTMAFVLPVDAAPPAQGGSAIGNLSLDSDYNDSHSSASWELTVTNQASLKGFAAYDVKVQIYPLVLAGKSVQISPGDSFDYSTGVWTIGSIHPRGSAKLGLSPRGLWEPDNSGSLVPRRACAVLISDVPTGDVCQLDNAVEIWFMEKRESTNEGVAWTFGDAGVSIRVDDRYPEPADLITFEIAAINDAGGVLLGGRAPIGLAADQLDVEVRVELSPGLTFFTVPDGFVADSSGRSGVWQVGHLSDGCQKEVVPCEAPPSPFSKVGQFQVMLATDPPPLEELCLTATVTNAVPWFEFDPKKRENDVARVCLGKEPPVVVNEGEIVLWWLHDCVGVTGPPCGADDKLKLFARVGHEEVSLPTIQRRDIFGTHTTRGTTYLDPESVIVQIQDPHGRQYDTNTHSVTDGTTVSWQTGRKDSGIKFNNPGSRIWYSRIGFNAKINDWTNIARTVSVSGLGSAMPPPPPPGRVKVRHDSSSASTFYDPAPPSYTHKRAPFNLTSPITTSNDYFLEFTSLGTYVVNFHALANHTNGTGYTASGNYIFHVGPIAELAVMDGGSSPLAATSQTAYTIQAANNGPDVSEGVKVTLSNVPEGSNSILTDGMYQEKSCAGGICEAEWDLGRLPVSSSRPDRGQTEFPTLTLIAPDGVPTPDITATIANNDPYSVVIDGKTHSTPFLDYIEENNEAAIMAQPGAGGGAPGTPQDLQATFFPTPPTAVVQWSAVESLNRWPVSHYQVRTDERKPCQAPKMNQDGDEIKGTLYLDSHDELSTKCYYVRAVNVQGVPGYWSEAVTPTSEGLKEPQLSLEAGPDVGEGETATFTVRASPAPVAGDTLVVNYTVTQQGGYVDAGELGGKDTTIDNRGRATITVPTLENTADEADGEVTVTLNDGLGYTLGTPSAASVAVLDDDNPTVSFAASPTEPLSEGNYTHNVTVNLDQPSHTSLDIYYTLGGDVGDENVRFAIPGSGRERMFTVGSGITSVDIPVRVLDPPDTRDDTALSLFLSPRHYYDVGSPASYTLTIIEDDGPRAEFALTESAVDEANATHNVVLNLNPPADGDVPISYSLNGSTATNGDDYSIEGVTGSTGSVSASDGETSVTIPLSIIADADAEGDETVVLTLLSSPDYTLGDDRKHTVTIRDDDLPRASFAAGTSNPGEGKGLHMVRVNFSTAAPRDGLTLRYGVGGTASRNRDYRVDNTTFALGGATGVDIWVEITDDGDNEPDETVALTLQAGSGYAVGDPGEHTVTIADDDLPLVAFAAEEASAGEASGTHRATILVEPASHEDFTVSYSVGGTATEGTEEDFTIDGLSNGSGTVTVPARASRVQVPITIRDDERNEGDLTVVLTLTGCDGCNLALPIRHELTIRDDDAPVVSFAEPAESVYEDNIGTHNVQVKLDRPAGSAFTLTYSVSSPALIGAGAMDYSVPDPKEARVIAGREYVDIPVEITPDENNEADERLTLRLIPGRGYSVGRIAEYTLTIVDDDNDENTPVVSVKHPNPRVTQGNLGRSEVHEGDGRFPTYYVDRENLPKPLDLIIEYVGGTATVNEDFRVVFVNLTEKGDVFTISAPSNEGDGRGATFARFRFSAETDNRAEGSETVTFRVVNGPGYTVREPTEYTITILNVN